ncbi:hypothetical protein B5F74_01030 [Collinsella sp. An271]|uniref:ABC transporter ATP-binding protein n=1 Tax=Collinsella sp. An271 TaxID=1965616 RepID=UPI000B3A3BAD|nr:ABC transporter ATP-binding protein [Collinsella sp. An271]OUO62488.1 hypothetical protein B5F74_01030 [Collinsella sp. An271]
MTEPTRPAAASRPALALHDVSVGHTERPLVEHIDLAVLPGQVTALIGPNGSGKTTLLKTIAGQLKPLSGSIELCGEDLQAMQVSETARIMSALFTGRPRTELLTTKDIVDAGRYPYTGRLGTLSDDDEQVVREVMEATGTWGLRDRDFAHMSDGQRQRALIARALCQQPRVLLLDEPTSYLDIRAQIDMLQLLRRYARERGIAVLASLHEIELAQKAADRIVCIRDGRVLHQGEPSEIFTAPVIADLYDLDRSSFIDAFGSVELPRPEGKPRVFVIAGGGSGAAGCFRELQQAGVPFSAGVLHGNDVDGLLAASLAATVICERDFEPISDEAIERAKQEVRECGALICCLERFGRMNARNGELVAYAHELGLPVFPSAKAYLDSLDR